MRKDLTEVVMVLDRSGSMASCDKEANAGIQSFLETQKNTPGSANLSVCLFDSFLEYPIWRRDLRDVDCKSIVIVPRMMTALLDAMGESIDKIGQDLRNAPEAERPGLVVFVTVTDGMENASSRYKIDQIKQMVQLQQDTYSWKFVYLGANQDAFRVAADIGANQQLAANYCVSRAAEAYTSAGGLVRRMRAQSLNGQQVNAALTDEDRSKMV
jgi:uncharacterized protein YegL